MTRATVRTAAWLASVAILLVAAADVAASSAVRPAPGTPDPRKLVLTHADLGRNVKVTAQGYYEDDDFPSVISYSREFENGRRGPVRLPYVDSEAEVGDSVTVAAITITGARKRMATEQGRREIRNALLDQLALGEAVGKVMRVGKPVSLGVAEDSFDLPVVLTYFGRRTELHLAAFRVERVLGVLALVGAPGQRVPAATVRQLAGIMAARAAAELLPTNVAPPSVAGAAAVGQTLTASGGAWTRSPTTVTFQWQRCDAGGGSCANVAGAAGKTYVVSAADVGSRLRVAVTARNDAGAATVASQPTSTVPPAGTPVNTALPSIAGTPQVGQVLTAQTGVWTDDPTGFGLQWQRCDASGAACVEILGATGPTYLVAPADVGSTIRVVVTAVNDLGRASATSPPTSTVT